MAVHSNGSLVLSPIKPRDSVICPTLDSAISFGFGLRISFQGASVSYNQVVSEHQDRE